MENTNYDVFAQWNGSNIELTYVPWITDAFTYHILKVQDGRIVMPDHPEWRYLGSFRTTDSDTWMDTETPTAETEMLSYSRLVWNEFNRLEYLSYAKFPTSAGTSNYTTDSYAHTGGALGEDTIQFLVGRKEDLVKASVRIAASNSGGTIYVDARPALDDTVGYDEPFGTYTSATNRTMVKSEASYQPDDGLHTIKLFRRSQNSGTTTWYLGATGMQSGCRLIHKQ